MMRPPGQPFACAVSIHRVAGSRRPALLERREALLADALDLLELVDRAEAAVGLPVGDDPRGQGRADSVQRVELGHRCGREAYLLVRTTASRCWIGGARWRSRHRARRSTSRNHHLLAVVKRRGEVDGGGALAAGPVPAAGVT